MSSHPEVWEVRVKDVDEARERILFDIRYMRYKVIYFDGWNGFGASAVLRSTAAVLSSRRTTPELCFDKIIYIDCSEWKNRRGVQRAIAKELQLDRSVMAILDKQDEDDYFLGHDESLRHEIDSVSQVIDQTLRGIKFIMIFLNGSDDEVDVGLMGVPLARYGNNMLIWTFSRSYLTMHRDRSEVAKKLRYTQIFHLSFIEELKASQFRGVLHQQAATIVARNPCMLDIDPAIIVDCCLYDLFLHNNFHTVTKFHWVSHASNYWICDATIQGDRARDISDALHREINWKFDASLHDHILKIMFTHSESPFLVIKDDDVYEEGPYRWISVVSRDAEVHGMKAIPAEASSFFLAFEIPNHPQALPDGFFDHCSKLGVLILYCCAFNFASPCFLKCHGLRFLGLDHCTDDKTIEGDHNTEWLYLYSLWVLDLRYTNWNQILSEEKMDLMTNIRELNIEGVMGWQYIACLQGRLPNLRRLRIIKPTCQWETSEAIDDYFIDKKSMEILDLSGNCDMKFLPTNLSEASSLRLLVLDGCDELESVGGLPPTLESVRFNGYGSASQWTQTVELSPKQFCPSSTTHNKYVRVSKISLAGCTQLEHLFLCWLPNLVELDLSGTSIKILDFKTMVVQIPRLKRLFLIGCKHLCAINFLHESVSYLELICVDTRAGIVCPRPSIGKNKPSRLQVHAVVVDARLAGSLQNLIVNYIQYIVHFNIHVTSSPVYDGVVQFEATSKDMIGPSDQESKQLIPAGWYSDVLGMVGAASPLMQTFPQPPTIKLDRHVEIAQGSFYVERELQEALGELMIRSESLHVHDVSVRAITPQGRLWRKLRWCCVERCPKVDIVFPRQEFTALETLWVSDLLMARSISSKGSRTGYYSEIISFGNLRHLQLRSCPSLQFVLPLRVPSIPILETLHIIHCGDLSHIFILNEKYPKEITTRGVQFPKLTTIHLHDLPKLQNICEVKMVAPALKSIKIRGCWSLRRLPSVGARGQGEKKPAIEIEKDVWDALEWDAGHRPEHLEPPVFSRYYKEKLPRVSVLR
ncbi:hypothetical protein VPH35_051918 [Triticum aestivum]